MSVLLLAQGDPEAKTLLRQAIEARYGLQPPVIESLQIGFKGRARAKVGPVTSWVPVEAAAHFRFPLAMRWDFSVRPLGVPVAKGAEAFDGSAYRTLRGGRPDVIADSEQVSSVRRRLWAVAALLLTPIGERFVKLTSLAENSFSATNTQLNDAVHLVFRPDRTLDRVEVECLNPDNARLQKFSLRLSNEQAPLNGLMLPRMISAFWDDEPYYQVEPTRAESNPQIADAVFTLQA